MNKLLEKMFDEEWDFYSYVDMMKDCSDEKIKVVLKDIAAAELQHYKKLYDIIFSTTDHFTALEKELYSHATCTYKEMMEILK